jgi:hypothetical protein
MTKSMCWRSRYYKFSVSDDVVWLYHILGAFGEFWFQCALINSFLCQYNLQCLNTSV